MSVEPSEKEFLEYMDGIRPPHEEDVLKFLSAVKNADASSFANKMEDERAHADRLAAEQSEDVKNLQSEISLTESKTTKYEDILVKAVKDASTLRLKASGVKALKKFAFQQKQKKKKKKYIKSFYRRGLLRTSMIGFKMFSRIIDKESLREKLTFKLNDFEATSIREKEEELSQLTKILAELKTQIQIENKKKLIIKDKLDQAFLRGASAICIEALTMSQSNLAEYLKDYKEQSFGIKSNQRYANPAKSQESLAKK